MASKTKTGFFPTVTIVAAFAIAAGVFYPAISKNTKHDWGDVVVTVDFDPPSRSGKPPPGRTLPDYVTVALTVGGKPNPVEKITTSPWIRTLRPKKNQLVVVEATQVYGKRLGCTITQPRTPGSFKSRVGPADVTCKHTAV